MKKCFLICPIGKDESETRKRSDKLLRHIIEPICSDLGYEVVRADLISGSDVITQTIIEHLTDSELVIADITNNNPNVFYELGYRQALSKPIIQIASQEQTVIPFDISSIRTIKYELYDPDNLVKAKDTLRDTIKSIEQNLTIAESQTDNVEQTSNNPIQLVASRLLDIENSIISLKESVENNNKETIKTVIQSLTPSKAEAAASIEEKLMMKFVDAAMKDPRKISQFIDLAEKHNK